MGRRGSRPPSIARGVWRRRGGALSRVHLLVVAALLAACASATAQVMRGGSDRRLLAPHREGLPEQRAGFTFCRLWYEAVRGLPSGLGWSTDYPGADHNLMVRLAEFTTADVSVWSDGEPGYAAVRATDPRLFDCPFLFVSDPGTVGLSEEENARLAEFLAKGGFIWFDDMWGSRAWDYWADMIGRVLPGHPIVEMPMAHPLFDTFYHVPEIPQIPAIQHWYRTAGQTSELGYDSAIPRMHGIFDDAGRLMVLVSHNTDVADAWEREGSNEEYFQLFAARGYAIGINVMIWAMTR